nr:otopetrin-1 [Monopterus albus]
MDEDSGVDIMSLNKYSNSSSSSSSSEHDKKTPAKIEHYPKKNAEIISCQYGTNLLLVGIALLLANATALPIVEEKHLLSYITSLMILQLIWMLWYVLLRNRRKNTRTDRDIHVTTAWIRGGLTVLAFISLIMDAFRVGYYVGGHSCVSVVLGVYPVIHAVHTLAQVHFLWFHIKDVIQSLQTFERFGVIHSVFTNLLLWCYGVVSEAEHYMNNRMRRLSNMGFINFTIVDPELLCNCTATTCTLFYKSLSYLFPFCIEYHVIVSAMLFVMWKNIGRTTDLSHKKRLATKTHCLITGPFLGLVALASTIGVMVVYLIHTEQSMETRQTAISIFYIYAIILLTLMCFAGVAGLLIYRVDHKPPDTSKNPSRELDTELLFGSSVGAWLMSWCSIVSVLSTSSNPPYIWMNFTYSLLIVLEKYIQNLFIIESLYRHKEDGKKEDPELPPSPETFSVTPPLPLPYNGIINQAYETPDMACVTSENEQNDRCSRKPVEAPQPTGRDLVEPSNVKKLILKNITVFLVMCNMSLWILPAFGCRPQFDNGLEQEIYGPNKWITVLNFAIPLNLFYRMHSVASLFEVFIEV